MQSDSRIDQSVLMIFVKLSINKNSVALSEEELVHSYQDTNMQSNDQSQEGQYFI